MCSGTLQNMKNEALKREEWYEHLVLADDTIPERAASLHQEHGVGVATFTIATSARAAVVSCPTAVEDLTRLHSNRGRDGL